MCPGNTARFDLALDELMPHEGRIGSVPSLEMVSVGLFCGIHESFALREHCRGVTIQWNGAVNTSQGSIDSQAKFEQQQRRACAVIPRVRV